MFAIARAEKGKRFPKDKVWGGLPAIDPDTATPGEIADFLIAEPARFHPRSSWERMINETRHSHEAITNPKPPAPAAGRQAATRDYAPPPPDHPHTTTNAPTT